MNDDQERELPAGDEIVSAEVIAESADVPPDAIANPPVTWREVGALILLVILCDLTIYRGHGWERFAAASGRSSPSRKNPRRPRSTRRRLARLCRPRLPVILTAVSA